MRPIWSTIISVMSNSKGRSQQKSRSNRFRPIGVAMQKPSKSICAKRGFHDQTLLNHWNEFAGTEFAGLCKPREIKSRRNGGAVLTVECLSSRASELAMRSDELRMRINARFGFEAIGKITFHHQHIGFEDKLTNEKSLSHAIQKRPPRPQPAKLSQELAQTRNNDLREALQRFSDSFYNKGAENVPD